MRLALLSALAEPSGGAGASGVHRPALRRFAGKSVLSHQIDCAALLGCERVVCLAGTAGPDLHAAKNYAERAGLRFDIAETILSISAQVTAGDDVILIADGVLPDRAALVAGLASGSTVLAFPAELALPMGFERLDATHAWSGALRTRGDSVAMLADLPTDCDLGSSLLRIALQRGAQVRTLEPASLIAGTWQRRVDRRSSPEAEWRWVARQVSPASFVAPGLALAERMALRWAHDAGGGRWARAPHWAAAAGGLLALGAGLASWPILGLGLLLAASFGLTVAMIFDRVEQLGTRPRDGNWLVSLAGWMRDGLLVALLVLLVEAEPRWLGIFVPMVLIGLLRLGQSSAREPLRALYGDRLVLLSILLAGAALGWTGAVSATVALVALGGLLWSGRGESTRITAD